jgi:hypothetical protein
MNLLFLVTSYFILVPEKEDSEPFRPDGHGGRSEHGGVHFGRLVVVRAVLQWTLTVLQ